MADNKRLSAGTADGADIATDEIGGVDYQRVKVNFGADGSTVDASSANPLPVVQTGTPGLPSGAATAALQTTLNGHVDGIEGLLTTIDADTSALAGTVAGSELQVDVVSSASHPVTNAGTFAVQVSSAIPAGTNNIGDVDVLSLPALPAGNNNIGDVDVASLPALPAGSNNIGDVDVLTIAAGTNAIGNVGIVPRTSGGLTTYHLVSAASTNATNIKASAGQLFGWYVYNSNAAARKLVFHNTAGTPTAGASVFFSVVLPPASAANVFSEAGIAFSTGIAITAVTGLADSDNTGVAANDLVINLWYA